MEIEHQQLDKTLHPATDATGNSMLTETLKSLKIQRRVLLFLNIILLLLGGSCMPLIVRVYFLHGGDHKWFFAFSQTAGFPILLVPIISSFLHRRRIDSSSRLFSLTPPLIFYCIIIGLITGNNVFLFSYGLSFLPVSTSSLLISMQLGFTAVFAFFIVKQKFTSFSINAVVLLTFGAAVLGVHANGDRPDGESKAKYFLGFVMTLGVAMIYGLVLPLVELMYKHAKQEVTYALVMEMQFVIGFSATVFSAIGMAINKDFQAISREAEHYSLGQAKYYLIVFSSTVLGQFFIGMVGTIKYSSALLGGVILAVCIPITEVLGVIFFHEKFDGEKGVALALSLWGTVSYFYGEYANLKKNNVAKENQNDILPVSLT